MVMDGQRKRATGFDKALAIACWVVPVVSIVVPFFQSAPREVRRHAIWALASQVAAMWFGAALAFGQGLVATADPFPQSLVAALPAIGDVLDFEGGESIYLLAVLVNIGAVLADRGPYALNDPDRQERSLARPLGTAALVMGGLASLLWAISLAGAQSGGGPTLDDAQRSANVLGAGMTMIGGLLLTRRIGPALGATFVLWGAAMVVAAVLAGPALSASGAVHTLMLGLGVVAGTIGLAVLALARRRRAAAPA